MAMGGNERRDGKMAVINGAVLRQRMAQRQLNGEGRRDGDSTTMDGKERRERNSDVDLASSGTSSPMC
jgi:hypothetical protein